MNELLRLIKKLKGTDVIYNSALTDVEKLIEQKYTVFKSYLAEPLHGFKEGAFVIHTSDRMCAIAANVNDDKWYWVVQTSKIIVRDTEILHTLDYHSFYTKLDALQAGITIPFNNNWETHFK